MFDAEIYQNYYKFSQLLSSFLETETDGFDKLEKVEIKEGKSNIIKKIDQFFNDEKIKPNVIVSDLDKYFSYSEFLKYANIYFPNTLILANLLEDYFGNDFLSIVYNSYLLEPDKGMKYDYSENENMVKHNLIMFSHPDRDFTAEAFSEKILKDYYEPIFETPFKYNKYPHIHEKSSLEDLRKYLRTMEFLSDKNNNVDDDMINIYSDRLNKETKFRSSYLAREDVKEDFSSIMLNVEDLDKFVDYLFDKKILSSKSKNLFEDSILISNSIDNFKSKDSLADILERQFIGIELCSQNKYFKQKEITTISNQSLKYKNTFKSINKILEDFDLTTDLTYRDISVIKTMILENFDKVKERYSIDYIDIAGVYNEIKTQMLLLNKGMIYPVIYGIFCDDTFREGLKEDFTDIIDSGKESEANAYKKMAVMKLDLLDQMRINERIIEKRYAPIFKDIYRDNLSELKEYIKDVEDYQNLLKEKDEILNYSNMIYYEHMLRNISIDIANGNEVKYTPLIDAIIRIRMGDIKIENNIAIYHDVHEINNIIEKMKNEIHEVFPKKEFINNIK